MKIVFIYHLDMINKTLIVDKKHQFIIYNIILSCVLISFFKAKFTLSQ